MNRSSEPEAQRSPGTPPPLPPGTEASSRPPGDEAGHTRLHTGIGQVYGSYRTLALLGEGGMGQVYLAEHVRLGRKVALKLLKRRLVQRPEALRQFFEEARAVHRIRHPNIVDVIDFVSDGEIAYYLMEYLPGKTLSQTLRLSGGALPPADVLRLGAQIADALQATHDAGIVHADVKPSNIFLHERPGDAEVQVKLMDFGAAQLLEEGDDDWAQQGTAPLFTPVYMSPEQGAGKEVDFRSDIYSLGVVLYEMLTGAPPFRATSAAEYCYKHMKEAPRRITQLRGLPFRVPRRAATAVMRCLAKDPAERFPSMAALREVLENPQMDSGRFNALSVGPAGAPARRRWPWIVAASVSVAVGIGMAALIWPSTTGQHPAALSAATPLQTAAESVERTLRIRSVPSGAEVFDLGPPRRLLGLTPLTLKGEGAAPGRRVVLRATGHVERVIAIEPGESREIDVELRVQPPAEPAPAPEPRPTTPATSAVVPAARPAAAPRATADSERPREQAPVPVRRRADDDGTVDPFH